MQLKLLALAATAATAFVIIPEISVADENIFKALPIFEDGGNTQVDTVSHILSLPCRQCEGRDSSLSLEVTVARERKLLLNGFEVFPDPDPWHGDLVATLESPESEPTKQKLGYSLAVVPEHADRESRLRLLDVNLKIIEVGDRFVNDVPAITVQLVMAPSGEFSIINVQTADEKEPQCTSMVCQIREKLQALRSSLRKCHGGRRRPKGTFVNGKRPHHGHGRHELGRFITNVAAQVLLPVLMGITAGVGVALYVARLSSPHERQMNLLLIRS